MAHFESQGCRGAVLAGTNGEGPSLGAVEKRDLIRGAMPLRGGLDLILGVSTSSLDEAKWLCEQAFKCGAAGALVMPPSYYKARDEGLIKWFEVLCASTELPIIAYNFPQRTGVELTAGLLSRMGGVAGVKDSSSQVENISSFPPVLGDRALFVGDETLLWQALEAGFTGTISGVANVMPGWLSQVVCEFGSESGRVKFEMALPAIRAVKAAPQPMAHKVILKRLGILERADVRLPLETLEDVGDLWETVRPFAG